MQNETLHQNRNKNMRYVLGHTHTFVQNSKHILYNFLLHIKHWELGNLANIHRALAKAFTRFHRTFQAIH